MGLFNFYISTDKKQLERIEGLLKSIHQQNCKLMSEVQNLKDKLVAQDLKLDAITGSVAGIKGDVGSLKAKIQQLIDAGAGATVAEIAELNSLADGIGAKVDAIGTATADLDAETETEVQP